MLLLLCQWRPAAGALLTPLLVDCMSDENVR